MQTCYENITYFTMDQRVPLETKGFIKLRRRDRFTAVSQNNVKN